MKHIRRHIFLAEFLIALHGCIVKYGDVNTGLEIGHFEKTQGEKTQNSRKNSITQGKNSRQIFAE